MPAKLTGFTAFVLPYYSKLKQRLGYNQNHLLDTFPFKHHNTVPVNTGTFHNISYMDLLAILNSCLDARSNTVFKFQGDHLKSLMDFRSLLQTSKKALRSNINVKQELFFFKKASIQFAKIPHSLQYSQIPYCLTGSFTIKLAAHQHLFMKFVIMITYKQNHNKFPN